MVTSINSFTEKFIHIIVYFLKEFMLSFHSGFDILCNFLFKFFFSKTTIKKKIFYKSINKVPFILITIIVLSSCGIMNKQNSKQRFGNGERPFWRNKTNYNSGTTKNNTKIKSLEKRNYVLNKKGLNTSNKKLSTNDYIKIYKDIAIKEMNYSGIPASITLAQGILESGNGNSELAKKSNNHFGIKCHKSWVGEKVYHDDDELQECFRKYKHPFISYKDHTNFIVSGYRYQFLFNYEINDYESWAKGLKKAGYATAPDYAENLIKLIEKYELYKYTNEFYNKHSIKIKKQKFKKKINKKEIVLSPLVIKKNNGRKYIIVDKGDTFFNISKRSKISVNELMAINNLKNNNIYLGQKLYLEKEIKLEQIPKLKNLNKKEILHVVKQGDTLYSISKKYSVSIDDIYSINKISKNQNINIGQKLIIPKG